MSKRVNTSASSPNLYHQISEATFTAQVIELARWLGWRVAHFRPAMTKRGNWVTAVSGDGVGFPDIFALRHNRRLMAELKSARGKLTPAQEEWLEVARIAGIEAYVWRPADIEQIEGVLK
jgi:hypothetical protein